MPSKGDDVRQGFFGALVAGALLRGVSCSAASACTAVGSVIGASPSASHTLALRWNGSAWSAQRTPSEAGNSFAGVSCSSATSCVAVGHGSGPSQALAERWDGTTWTVQEAVSPGEASLLEGVTCRSEVAITAAGAYQTSQQLRTLVETYE